MSSLEKRLVSFDEYEVDRARFQLCWRSEPVPLSRKTFDLLLFLIDHADRVVTKDELLRSLWPESFVEESNLTQHIFLLRKALSRHPSGTKMIETVAGRGYRFAAPIQSPSPTHTIVTARESITRFTLAEELEEEETDTPDTPALAANILPRALSASSPAPRTDWIIGAAILLVVLCAAAWLARQHWLDRSGGAPVQLVLTPLDGTTGDAILDKSLTQALRMDLAQSPYVSVVPDSTVQATLAQMMHKPGDPVTPAMAREICERTNSQGVLSGNIARVGQHFLLTEEASNCVDGSVVASDKYEANQPEDLPRTIDKLAASLRQKLGESRRSIARFDMPLIPTNTASLEALKDYTQAVQLANQGKFPDAITLLKSALQLDPNFAAARYALAVYYLSTNDFVNGRAAILKAYEVRDSASEPVRLAITAFYETYSTQDLFAAERNFRSWTELYPRSVPAWNGLYIVQRDLGHHADSAASALKALALNATTQTLYEDAAGGQLTSGDMQGARATLDSAVAHNLDGDRIRSTYLQLAVLLNDANQMRAQQTWIDAHPDAAYCRMQQVYLAVADGRFADAHRQLQQVTAMLRQQGLSGLADALTKSMGATLIHACDRDAGTLIFRSVALDPEDGDDLIGLALAGDLKTAETDLLQLRARYPQGTLSQHYFGPFVEASIALSNHHPQQAIDLMEATRPLDDRDMFTRKFRGDLYLAAGQPALAEKEFRTVLAHREIASESADYALSWLGLGRALAAQHNVPPALEAYHHFLTLWAHADPDALYLAQAKQELAALHPATSPQ